MIFAQPQSLSRDLWHYNLIMPLSLLGVVKVGPSLACRISGVKMAWPSSPHSRSGEVATFVGVVTEPGRHLRQELTSIGLLAIQIVAAAARIRDGATLDAQDRRTLELAIELFKDLAKRIRFIQSGGQVGDSPSLMMSTEVTDQLVVAETQLTDPEEVAKYFDEVAGQLRKLLSAKPSKQLANDVYKLFFAIAARAKAAAGSSGHITSRPITPRF